MAASIFCAPARADYTVIDGRLIVSHGIVTTLDLPTLIDKHNRLARELVNG